MTELELARQRIEALVDRWRHHPDRIEPADACDQILAALDEPLPVEEQAAMDPDRNCGDPYSGIGCADPDCTHRPANWPLKSEPTP